MYAFAMITLDSSAHKALILLSHYLGDPAEVDYYLVIWAKLTLQLISITQPSNPNMLQTSLAVEKEF